MTFLQIIFFYSALYYCLALFLIIILMQVNPSGHFNNRNEQVSDYFLFPIYLILLIVLLVVAALVYAAFALHKQFCIDFGIMPAQTP